MGHLRGAVALKVRVRRDEHVEALLAQVAQLVLTLALTYTLAHI